MEELNPQLIIYRLEKLEKMMEQHNQVHEKHLSDILLKLNTQYNREEIDEKLKEKAGSWVETAVKSGITTIITAVILAILGMVLAPKVLAGIHVIYHIFV